MSKSNFDTLVSFQKKLEFEPVNFLDNHLYQYLKESRSALSNYINCDRDDIAFFQILRRIKYFN